ncbi:hypothetical protein FKP32DRAFT_1607244 [Trametes sanguinea]|nr:hypothetical protein FKP32DRAFT_1607244 [Trametes sanguinea]
MSGIPGRSNFPKDVPLSYFQGSIRFRITVVKRRNHLDAASRQVHAALAHKAEKITPALAALVDKAEALRTNAEGLRNLGDALIIFNESFASCQLARSDLATAALGQCPCGAKTGVVVKKPKMSAKERREMVIEEFIDRPNERYNSTSRSGARVNKCHIAPVNRKIVRKDHGTASSISMVANLNLTWKTPCMEILQYKTVEDHASDWQWARRQADEAQNHIFHSLGERYGLRIIPESTSFLVLPYNISRSTRADAILHPSGPAPRARSRTAVAWLAPEATEDTDTEFDFVFAVGKDEKLMRRLNELDNAEMCSTGSKGTDAKWKREPDQVLPACSGLRRRSRRRGDPGTEKDEEAFV